MMKKNANANMTFSDYCEDFLDLDPALMTDEQLKSAKEGFRSLPDPADIAKHQKQLAKAKESRKLAKFYGGKALTGTAAQKKWGEDIRQKFLEGDWLNEEQKKELVTCGGFTDTAKFWIENRNVAAAKMTSRAIVAQYKQLSSLIQKNYRTLVATASVSDKNAARKEIKDYLASCDFNFTSQIDVNID